MKIVIKSRYTNIVMHEHNAESLKEAVIQLVKDGANLHGAYLYWADLHGADLHGADLYGAYLHGANLHGANLHGADLHGAYLHGADLHGANLGGAKNYSESHDVFCELIKRRKASEFTTKEWECIAHICIHRICWDTIKKRFQNAAMRVFKKLAKVGYDEYLIKFKEESQ